MVEEDLKLLSQNDKKNDKIFVAGHNGLVGSAVLRKLRENNFKNYFRGKKKLDLFQSKKKVENFKENQTKTCCFISSKSWRYKG